MKYLEDKHGYKIFEIITDEKSNHYVDFTVNEIISWGDGKTPEDTEHYLQAYMKWDNCNHFWFGDKSPDDNGTDGYLHICGGESMVNHIMLMEFLYDYAFEVMGRENGEELPK